MRGGEARATRANAVGIGVALAALSMAFACRQIVGIHDEPDPKAAAPSCGLPAYTGACGTCLAQHCCAEAKACDALSSCNTYSSCLAGCNGDMQCRAQCNVDDVIGTRSPTATEAPALRLCLATSCSAECGLECNARADYVAPPSAAGACQSCVKAHLCDLRPDAAPIDLSELDNESYLYCHMACTTPDCQQACTHTFLHDKYAIALGECDRACATGENWACAGKPWSPSVTDQVTITFHGVSDSVAQLCGTRDCARPIASGFTDDAGSIVFREFTSVNATGPGADQYYHLVPAPGSIFDGGTPPYVATSTFIGHPISQPTFSIGTIINTPDDLAKLIRSVGEEPDATRGQVAVIPYDCLGNAALNVQVDMPGIDLTSDAGSGGTHRYYFAGVGRPSPRLTATTGAGVGFTNVPIGPIELTATPIGLGKTTSRVTVYVRAGELTVANMVPTP